MVILILIIWLALFICGIYIIVDEYENLNHYRSWYNPNCLFRFEDFVKMYDKKLSWGVLCKNKIFRIFSPFMLPVYICVVILFFIFIVPIWVLVSIIKYWIAWVNGK